MTEFSLHLPPAAAPRTAAPPAPPPDASAEGLRRVAREFEAAFLAEMLGHAGLGRTPEAFGGGAGEDAFASFLVKEHADLMAERGGIGLAETIFEALVARSRAA